MELNKIINGNSSEVLKEMPENFIDTVITDPPYGLSEHSEKTIREVLSKWLAGEEDYVPLKKGFMDKEWDAFVPPPALWKEVYRVMKPGAAIMVFAGSRTYDLMTMALRLSGFEIKDTLMWIYGSGFPKAYDIAKGIENKVKQGTANWTDWKKLDGEVYERKTGYVKLQVKQGYRNDYSEVESKDIKLTTSESKLWGGYKTALKPAYEPIILAIKPNDGCYADNALKWGVAGLNIDGGRIEMNEKIKWIGKQGWREQYVGGMCGSLDKCEQHPKGRFPANVILECTCDEVIETDGIKIHTNPKCPCYILDQQSRTNASRFFYCAKASKRERNIGCEDLELKPAGGMAGRHDGSFDGRITYNQNTHPTVKPLKLCEYLVKLTLMPNPAQIYLDPFAGSGSILMAVKMHGKNYIGIEMSEEYARIAMARLASIK